jgi:hypothetical protein
MHWNKRERKKKDKRVIVGMKLRKYSLRLRVVALREIQVATAQTTHYCASLAHKTTPYLQVLQFLRFPLFLFLLCPRAR